MIFNYRKAVYKLERDSHCFVLSKQYQDEWIGRLYFSDMFYLLKHLVSIHAVPDKDIKEIKKHVTATLNDLKNSLEKVI